mgnify:CR=1 FL=1
MSAVMIVQMTISDESWIAPYFEAVPPLLAEYGAVPVAGSRAVRALEGGFAVPDRVAVLRFPSLAAIDRFMADPRYRQYRAMRESGSEARILVFEDQSVDGGLA